MRTASAMPVKSLVLTVVFLSSFAAEALAQSPQAQPTKQFEGEIVMTAAGTLVAPWVETTGCRDKNAGCPMIIVNLKTREIARVDDRWSTRFQPSGNGQEIRRVETSLAKAERRLSGERTPEDIKRPPAGAQKAN